MTTRRSGLVAVALFGLGIGTLALASTGDAASRQEAARPTAVQPASEAPSSSFLVLQEQAVPQPSGEHRDGVMPVVPRIYAPER